MDIWKSEVWKDKYKDHNVRKGLRLKFDRGIDEKLKTGFKEYCRWLRSEYTFPIRVPVYVKNFKKIKAMDGEYVFGTFLGPFNFLEEPYVRVAAGDFKESFEEMGEQAVYQYLCTLTHELTHYFQWLNNSELTQIGKERQATITADRIVQRYVDAHTGQDGLDETILRLFQELDREEKQQFLHKLEQSAKRREINEAEIDKLRKIAFEDDVNNKILIARILEESKLIESEKILLHLTKDIDDVVRMETCNALSNSDSLEVYEALKGIASKDSVGMVRGYAIVALGDVAVEINKEKEATKFLKNLLKREKTDFAIIDIWAVLYCLGEERWLSYLLEKIDSSKSSERCEVANCLYGIVDEENKEQIKTILQKRREIEKSEEVIESIEEVLNIIKKDYNKKGM